MDLSNYEIPQILFLFLTDQFGEDEQFALEDVMELDRLGIKWSLICIENSQVHIQLKNQYLTHLTLIPAELKFIFDKNFSKILKNSLQDKIGLIHCYGTHHLSHVLPVLLKYSKIPAVVSEGPLVRKTLRHFFQSFFYSRIDAMLVPSSVLKKRIGRMRPILAHKIRVVHPGLDFDVFNPNHFDFNILRKTWGIGEDVYVVGMIASQEYKKAQAVFIKAAASFLRNEELAKRTQFVIIGFDNEGNEELIDLIKQFHLEDHIIFAPPEVSIPKILGSLDVYILPSSKAMFGLQAIEALAMGTPIICASGPDSEEWIGNSQSGLLMRSGDSFDLQRKLKMILEDPEELKLMGMRSVKYVRENYDRKRRTEKLLEIYKKAIRRRNKNM